MLVLIVIRLKTPSPKSERKLKTLKCLEVSLLQTSSRLSKSQDKDGKRPLLVLSTGNDIISPCLCSFTIFTAFFQSSIFQSFNLSIFQSFSLSIFQSFHHSLFIFYRGDYGATMKFTDDDKHEHLVVKYAIHIGKDYK